MGAKIWFLVGATALAGCSGGGAARRPDLGVAVDAGGTGGGGAAPDLAAAPPADLALAAACTDGDAYCKSWNVRSACVGGAWVDQTCAGGCYAGACSASACADECALGETSAAGTCRLWDVGTGAFVAADDAAHLHDRARDYDALRRAHQLVEGAVCNAVYSDATRATLAYFSGTGDAALWSGTSLAAEAWRYRATGAPDAADEIARLSATLHRLFNVSGETAYLARLAVPSSDTTPLEYMSRCSNGDWHCGTPYAGQSWDWYGHISRDAYTGVMLGYDAAYAATRDESVRAAIRADVVRARRRAHEGAHGAGDGDGAGHPDRQDAGADQRDPVAERDDQRARHHHRRQLQRALRRARVLARLLRRADADRGRLAAGAAAVVGDDARRLLPHGDGDDRRRRRSRADAPAAPRLLRRARRRLARRGGAMELLGQLRLGLLRQPHRVHHGVRVGAARDRRHARRPHPGRDPRRQDVGRARLAEEPVLRVLVGRDARAGARPPRPSPRPRASWRSSRRDRASTSPSTTPPTPGTSRTTRPAPPSR